MSSLEVRRIPDAWRAPDVDSPERTARILARYRAATVVVRCVCGGVLEADGSDADVTDAVSRHQRTATHRAWWLRSGWPGVPMEVL